MRNRCLILPIILTLVCVPILTAAEPSDPYNAWQHNGSMFILTTSEGVDLPANAVEEGFPLLVRLHKDFFNFAQAQPHGEDLRVASSTRAPLPFQIEDWDAVNGTACIWVRLPKITGNSRQEIRLYWGKPDVASESNSLAVFNISNSYQSVWHMSDPAKDEVADMPAKDNGTSSTVGIIGKARHFSGECGIFCDKNPTLPSGSNAHSVEMWFRAEHANGSMLGFGDEKGQGKVVMYLSSPPHLDLDCYFSNGNISSGTRLPMNEWIHVLYAYQSGDARLYVNGRLDGTNNSKGSPLAIKSPARLWIGGWMNRFNFIGDIDEIRISKVARSADWALLEYENQKSLQTLVGPLVSPGTAFSVSQDQATVAEGERITFKAEAGGAQKYYWILKSDGRETVLAVDRLEYTFAAGRVSADTTVGLQFKAIYPNGIKSRDIAINIKEAIPDPVVALNAPTNWNGRDTIEIVPQIMNRKELEAKGVANLNFDWNVSGIATHKEIVPGKLILKFAQNSGKLKVRLTTNNGGGLVSVESIIQVNEPEKDAWVNRTPSADEKPEDNQFYAREGNNEGTLYYNGKLAEEVDSVFLRLYADGQLYKTVEGRPGTDMSYALTAPLKPGLIKYKVEFGTKKGNRESVLRTVNNIVCGDAFIIEGQSNALATDTHEESPPETHEWICSYGNPAKNSKDVSGQWCNPVWKARKGEPAELGWWGMELAKRMVESQKIPIFIINGAVGGTLISQHKRNEANPADLSTIYGRMLWRAQQARLTHGIRGIIWHQGENNQGSAGPTGDFDWKSYEQDFVEMSAGWKRDFPNVQHYYVFQIWPNACSMAGNSGAGDMIREIQRSLPQLYSHMSAMSTLGIKPPGGCHYPLAGWSEFARLIQPLIERDMYGKIVDRSITPPNLMNVYYSGTMRDTLTLEFDQPIRWDSKLISQFYINGESNRVESGSVNGTVLTLKLKEPGSAKQITYLKESHWSQDNILLGENGIAALTFCSVPIGSGRH